MGCVAKSINVMLISLNFAKIACHTVWPVVCNHQLGIFTVPNGLPDFCTDPYLYPCPYPQGKSHTC